MILARRVGVTLLVGVALFLFVYAFSLGTGNDRKVAGEEGVERFLPSAGSALELRQTRIGVELLDGWSASLRIDGVEIPEDQLNCFDDCFDPKPGADPQGIAFYSPGPGKVIEELESGRRCATATLWRPAAETSEQGRPVTWCFRVA